MTRKRIAILISGRGSNLPALFRADLGGDIVAIGSNKADAKGLDLARDAGIATFVVSHKAFATREAFDAAMVTNSIDTGPILLCFRVYEDSHACIRRRVCGSLD